MITNGYEAYEEYNGVDDNYGVEETRDSNAMNKMIMKTAVIL